MVGITASGLAAVLVAGALSAPAGAERVSGAPIGRAAVRFHSTSSHHAVAPDRVRPGIAHLRSTTNAPVLVVGERRRATTESQLVRALNGRGATNFLQHFTLVAEDFGKTDSYVRLTPGTYYFVALGSLHPRAANIKAMTVSGTRVDARLPSSHKVVITRTRRLSPPGSLPTRGYLHVVNRSYALASLLFVGVANRTTYKALRDLVAHPSLIKLLTVASFNLSSLSEAEAGPKLGSWQPFRGRPGRYVIAALAVTSGGRFGLHHGQVRTVKVK